MNATTAAPPAFWRYADDGRSLNRNAAAVGQGRPLGSPCNQNWGWNYTDDIFFRDTPGAAFPMNALRRHDGGMSFPANRTRRVTTMPTVVMQARVISPVRDQVQAAAEASGVTMSYYLEALLLGIAHERGELPTVPKPGIPTTQQELPIQMAS